MAKTRAIQALDQARVAYTLHTYDYDPDAERIGVQAAEGLGVPVAQVFKTLMMTVDGRAVCVLAPSDREVSLKKVAAAHGGRSAQMMRPADAERVTGYHVGGISPFGQKRRAPALIDASALEHETIFINGGQRGLQVRLRPQEAADALGAVLVEVVAAEVS